MRARIVLAAALLGAACGPARDEAVGGPWKSPESPLGECRDIVARISAASKQRSVVQVLSAPERTGPPPRRPESPAETLLPGTEWNKTAATVILIRDEMRLYARDRDEGAFILGHELAHLELDHDAKRLAAECAEINAWLNAGKAPRDCAGLTKRERSALWRGEGGFERPARLIALAHEREFEADARGAELAEMAGYSSSASIDVLQSMVDRYRRDGIEDDAINVHPTARLENLRRVRGR